jgi:hypothetical protein
MPNPPVVPSQKNNWVIGCQPASAYTAMTARPVTLCASDAAFGMLLPPVRPSAAGRTFSRPRAYRYRQRQLWNASAAADRGGVDRAQVDGDGLDLARRSAR